MVDSKFKIVQQAFGAFRSIINPQRQDQASSSELQRSIRSCSTSTIPTAGPTTRAVELYLPPRRRRSRRDSDLPRRGRASDPHEGKGIDSFDEEIQVPSCKRSFYAKVSPPQYSFKIIAMASSFS